MKRIDFRLDEEWYALAVIMAKDMHITVHHLAYLALADHIQFWSGSDTALGRHLREEVQRQRQPDGQRQR